MKRKMAAAVILAVLTAASALVMSGCGGKASEDSGGVSEEDEKEADDDDRDDDDNDGVKIVFSDNQDDAELMPTDKKLYGSIESGEYWFAFKTGKDKNADYRITIIDKAADSSAVNAAVYDEYGEELCSGSAGSDGLSATLSLDDSEPKTAYYVCMSSSYSKEAEFMLMIRDFNDDMISLCSGDSSSAEEDSVILAANMDDAGLVPLESKIESSISDGYQYFAFIPEDDGEYRITLVNETSDSSSVDAAIYDEYGEKIESGSAGSNGRASTFSMGELESEEVYYIQIHSAYNKEADYTFTIREPETEKRGSAKIDNDDED